MMFAYADPPYLGCCKLYKHHHPDGRCWDDVETHRLLIDQLTAHYPDGWAMSASSTSLRTLLPLCPEDVRVAPWAKPFASFKPNVNPGFTWEALIWQGGRDRDRWEATIKDHVIAMDPALIESITLQKGLTGAKPVKFCLWLFDVLGMRPEDELDDLFPGTGIVSRMWDEWRTRSVPKPLTFEIEGAAS